MQLIRFVALSLFTFAFAVQPAAAYVQYTYSTDILTWESSFYNSESYEEEMLVDGASSPAFRFSFAIPDDVLSTGMATTFIVNNADVWISPEFFGWYPKDLAAKSNGKVFLNADGSIASWNLIFSLKEILTSASDLQSKLENYKIHV
ncbi:MAG: hypothetical protein EOO68_36835, partial [Moraxellaceae bacterium]